MTMMIECCSQERTFKRFYGLLAQRFCYKTKTYADLFEVGRRGRRTGWGPVPAAAAAAARTLTRALPVPTHGTQPTAPHRPLPTPQARLRTFAQPASQPSDPAA